MHIHVKHPRKKKASILLRWNILVVTLKLCFAITIKTKYCSLVFFEKISKYGSNAHKNVITNHAVASFTNQ